MRRRFLSHIGVYAVFILMGSSMSSTETSSKNETNIPVIIELFTSQGCSSCPPADNLLQTLTRNQPVNGAFIIPLSEHVDYWNRLGWKDPFSSKQFSDRQRKYAEVLGTENIYTPMMIVDGVHAFVGSRSTTAREVIVSALKQPKAKLMLHTEMSGPDTVLSVRGKATELPASNSLPEAWLAITEHLIQTEVTHGENAFRTLSHTGVVRKIQKISFASTSETGTYEIKGQIHLNSDWLQKPMRMVVFLQVPVNGRILGATQYSLK
tara:strand:- start:11261 stop:12055 length:795 start_codon:yes stop_codon:yes gene_type:complete